MLLIGGGVLLNLGTNVCIWNFLPSPLNVVHIHINIYIYSSLNM